MSNGTEQEARIALLDYYGSLARHWATVLLAIAVALYSVVQVRKVIGDWLFLFTAAMMAGGVVYAFLRMYTLGKYCELALDPNVRPRGSGVRVSQMLQGMKHEMRSHRRDECLDKMGKFWGFVCWTLGWASAFLAIAVILAFLGFPSTVSLQGLLTNFLALPCGAFVLVVAVVVLLLLPFGFRRIRLCKYENEKEIPLNDFEEDGIDRAD